MRRGLVTSSQYSAVVEESSSANVVHDSSSLALASEASYASRLVSHLHTLLHGATLYQPGDSQFNAHLSRAAELISRDLDAIGLPEARITFLGRRLEVNDRPFRGDLRLADREQWLLERAATLGIGAITLANPLTTAAVSQFVTALAVAAQRGVAVQDMNWGSIALRARVSDASIEAQLSALSACRRFDTLALYAEALALTRAWGVVIQQGGVPTTADARHLAARLIDAHDRDASGLLGMLALRPIEGTFGSRRLDAAILAIGVLRTLEFREELTLEIATAALVRRVPDGWGAWWVRAPGDARAAAQLAFDADTAIAQVISFESAAPVGLSIPDTYYGRPVQPHVATLVMNVACGYVDLLQPGQASNPFSPEAALQMMIAQGEKYFEPTVVAALTRTLGAWPPGSVVRLNSGDFAVVIERSAAGAQPSRPIIRPVDGTSMDIFDLGHPDLAPYRIVSSANPADCPANPMLAFIH